MPLRLPLLFFAASPLLGGCAPATASNRRDATTRSVATANIWEWEFQCSTKATRNVPGGDAYMEVVGLLDLVKLLDMKENK
jgi:hypothetical protein